MVEEYNPKTINRGRQMTRRLSELTIIIKGGGEVASGIAHMLHRSHFRVCLTEIANPLAVSRGTAFSEAVFDGAKSIEGVTAQRVSASPEEIHRTWQQGNIPLVIDPEVSIKDKIKPDVLIDATMAKLKTGISISAAPLVIGMGPSFYASRNVHIVVETNHSDNLGRLIFKGEAEANTGTPVVIGGLGKERVIWAPIDGIFTTDRKIGDTVEIHQNKAHITANKVIASAKRLIDVRHFCLNNNKIAEINVPA